MRTWRGPGARRVSPPEPLRHFLLPAVVLALLAALLAATLLAAPLLAPHRHPPRCLPLLGPPRPLGLLEARNRGRGGHLLGQRVRCQPGTALIKQPPPLPAALARHL